MAAPDRDTRGIVDPAELLARVRFRRPEPAEPLRPYIEHYWLIDWDLTEPYVSHVVPHPAVHIVFQRLVYEDAFVEVAGIPHGLFAQKLEGRGRVCGIKFRPGAFRSVAPERPVSEWTGRRVRQPEVFPDTDPATVLDPADETARVAALDAFLLALGPRPDPQAELAATLVDRIRTDRTIRRVTDFARAEGLSVRLLQRLFARLRRRRPEVGHPALPHPRRPGASGSRRARGLGDPGRRPRLRRPGPPDPRLHSHGRRDPDDIRPGRTGRRGDTLTPVP